jgi:hypothetical protein
MYLLLFAILRFDFVDYTWFFPNLAFLPSH